MEESPVIPPAEKAVRSRRMTAVLLLLVAGAALVGQYTNLNFGKLVPLFLGLAFLVWSLWAREWGLLVPGGILTGLGTGLMFQELLDLGRASGTAVFLFCFAGGWVLIVVLSKLAFNRRVLWPFWPAGAMVFAGLTQMGGPDLQEWFRWARPYWPFALILVALFLWFSKPSNKQE